MPCGTCNDAGFTIKVRTIIPDRSWKEWLWGREGKRQKPRYIPCPACATPTASPVQNG